MGKTEDKWNANYDALKAFVETYHQRLIKQGKLAVERVQLLSELSKMRILK